MRVVPPVEPAKPSVGKILSGALLVAALYVLLVLLVGLAAHLAWEIGRFGWRLI